MNSEGTSTTTLIELIRELLVEMDEFIDKLPVELPERGHHDEFVFICLYRYARDLSLDLNLLIEATTIGADTYISPGMHILCRSLLVTCIDTYYIKQDPKVLSKRFWNFSRLVVHPNIYDSEQEQTHKSNQFRQLYSENIDGKVKKPRTNDWSGLSPEEKIKKGIQLYFSTDDEQITSDYFFLVYNIFCNHVHGNFVLGMYTTSSTDVEEEIKTKKDKQLTMVGKCMFTCIALIMQNIYELYDENTDPIDNLWKRFVAI